MAGCPVNTEMITETRMKRIGIIGGTFDPVHFGHLILAEQARTEACLDQVVFMPAMVQPFKLNKKSAEGEHRLAMLREAIAGNPYFSVSGKELDSPEISYTIHTLRELRKQYGTDTELCFIIGTDAFLSVEKWYAADELLEDYVFVVGMRPGYREEELSSLESRLREQHKARMIMIRNPEVEISSTEIKERIREGKSIRYLLPERVEAYIYKNKLYLETEQ
jgi:nicotinate-nucleotide adenylyltransferase